MQPVLWYWLIKGYHTLTLSNGPAEQQMWELSCVRGDKRAVNFFGHHNQLPFPQPSFPVSCQSMNCLRGSAPNLWMFQCQKSYNSTRTATEILSLIDNLEKIFWKKSGSLETPPFIYCIFGCCFLKFSTSTLILSALVCFLRCFPQFLCLRVGSLHWGRFSCIAAEFIKGEI